MSLRHNRLLLFATVFLVAIVVDLMKFLALGKPTIINWESFVHPAWVITANVVMFLSVYYSIVRQIAFWVYLIIFAAAYVNIYLGFTEILTYFCMIFNLVLTAVYFLTGANRAERIDAIEK